VTDLRRKAGRWLANFAWGGSQGEEEISQRGENRNDEEKEEF